MLVTLEFQRDRMESFPAYQAVRENAPNRFGSVPRSPAHGENIGKPAQPGPVVHCEGAVVVEVYHLQFL